MKQVLFILLLCVAPLWAQNKTEDKSLAGKIAGLQKIDGYMPLYWDAASGKLWLEVTRFNQELLYQVSLPAGVGSNPIGLDRGQLGQERIVYFERIGPKVLLTQPNYRYRALGNDAAERKAVRDSFAQSVLWGFPVEAEEGGRVRASPFAKRRAGELGVDLSVPNVRVRRTQVRTPARTVDHEDRELCIVIRRNEFDASLANACRERGLSLRENEPVVSLERTATGWPSAHSWRMAEMMAVSTSSGMGSPITRARSFSDSTVAAA